MNDREYLKINTSIQTGSNATTLLKDEEGNPQATIELRLPSSLFETTVGNRTIDNVEMLTTKMRLSMEKMPIAQIPRDSSKTSTHAEISTCQMDIYPFSFLNNKTLTPSTLASTPFPYYKEHYLSIEIKACLDPTASPRRDILLERLNCTSNSVINSFPKESRFYDYFMQIPDLALSLNHSLNLFFNKDPSSLLKETDETLFVTEQGRLTQALQDSLENAVTFASTETDGKITIYLVTATHGEDITPIPPPTQPFYLSELETSVVYWYYTTTQNDENTTNHLAHAFKPYVELGDSSLKIEYDSAAFNTIIPVLWNTGYVDTFDMPQQMRLDALRNSEWGRPPPKRQYKYGVSSGETGYDYTLSDETCGVVNIIGNRSMKETFNFLPWMEIDAKEVGLTLPADPYQFIVQNIPQIQEEKKPLNQYLISPKEGATTDLTCKAIYPRGEGDSGKYRLSYTIPIDATEDYDVSLRSNYFLSLGGYNGFGNKHYDNFYVEKEEMGALTLDYGATYEQIKRNSSKTTTLVPGEQTLDTFSTTKVDIASSTTTDIRDFVLFAYHSTDPDVFPTLTFNDITWKYGIDLRVDIPQENWRGTAKTTWWSDPGSLYRYWIPPDFWTSATSDFESGNPHPYTDPETQQVDPTLQLVTWEYTAPAYVQEANNICSAFYLFSVLTAEQYANLGNYVQRRDSGYRVYQTITLKEIITLNPNYTPPDANILSQYPNLEIDDGKFYILDGEATDVDLGNQEPIEETANLYTVTDVVTTTPLTASSITKYAGTSLNSDGKLQIVKNSYDILGTLVAMIHGTNSTGTYDVYCYGFLGSFYYQVDYLHATGDFVYYTIKAFDDGDNLTPTSTITEIQQLIGTNPGSNTEGTPVSATSQYQSNDTTLTVGTSSTEEIHYNIGTEQSYVTSQAGDLTKETCSVLYYPPTSLSRSDITLGNLNIGERQKVNLRTGPLSKMTLVSETPFYPAADPTFPTTYRTHVIQGKTYIEAAKTWVTNIKIKYVTGRTISYDSAPWSLAENYAQTGTKQMRLSTPFLEAVETVTHVNEKVEHSLTVAKNPSTYVGNTRISFTWKNLPMILMSPVASIVLTLQGIDIKQEMQPINMTNTTGSSLTAVMPIIENYYSLASTLRDLHDELVVVKEGFDDQPKYITSNIGGQERTITLSAKYITKDGRLHQIYIPPNGVFSLQLTFALNYVYI